MSVDQDTEMSDETQSRLAPTSISTMTDIRRTSTASNSSNAITTSSTTTYASTPTVTGFPSGASLANLIHNMDVSSEPERIHETDEEEDSESEGEGEEVEGELQGEEGEDEDDGEDEEDDEEDDEEEDDDEEDEEGKEYDTGEPISTATIAAPPPPVPVVTNVLQARPKPKPNAPPRSSISISDLTENGVEGPLPVLSAKGVSIPVLLHTDGNAGESGISVTVTDTSQPPEAPPESSTSTLTSPPSSAETADSVTTTKPTSKKGKPKSKVGKQRSASPSPPPQPAPPPLQTIRLDIALGGPSNYEVDVSQMAKETGQRPMTPPLLGAVVESEVEEPAPSVHEEGDGGGGKKKRKKKNAAQEYYDTSDPFIDDSELAVDQRTYFAQTKQQGFYVSSGEVALMKDNKSPKKPKSKKLNLTQTLHASASKAISAGVASAGPSAGMSISTAGLNRTGSHDGESPVLVDGETASSLSTFGKGLRGVGMVTGGVVGVSGGANVLPGMNGGEKGKKPATGADAISGWTAGVPDEEADEKTGQKRKRYITVVEGGKKRKIVNVHSFHPELQAAIEELKLEIEKENWEHKGKFPPGIKPHLAKLALLAIKLDEYDDHFFNLMPVLFPYNKYTMTKLIKRTVYPDHVALLQDRQEQLLKQLEDLSKAGFLQAEQEWEKSVAAWDKRQEKMRLEVTNAPPGSAPPGEGGSANGSAAPTRHPTEEKDGMDVDNPSVAPSTAVANAHTANPPGKKYRLTEQMKAIIWDLVLLSNECCRLENEKNVYEGSALQVSEQGLRKVLYQKIVAAFPEGWMSSGQISRDVSAMKKRLEKEAMDNEP
ncbi:hypothetical protein FA15DRAFT_174391 [Coprinopsis marcescibilis]|uniref:Ubinuclein middle domain-containing protein n=1 Tax=Coprinopsis marcescibilis TaxID=230819 RepID=A0A5C3KHG0_COPMA|nr:hypothetical protein FA15DRAFT_174391 [Coprinopsis marcescibilis]